MAIAPSRQYTAGLSPSFHPTVVRSPLLDWTMSVPVLRSMKLPVP